LSLVYLLYNKTDEWQIRTVVTRGQESEVQEERMKEKKEKRHKIEKKKKKRPKMNKHKRMNKCM